MAKNNFIKQLTELKKEFLEYAKDNSAKVIKDTFEIAIVCYVSRASYNYFMR